ncbi:FemAB family PEP-CTERM system-associated protein [Qipengyuania sp. 6B39]|uniref:FemAB family XrtA/PEP-CTERM system-associated protein n=1 Tax=Qipengyuania proteolytica TaxID=2867239 RepID=UPI001C89BCD6|nr:FemAB family XrtA/PEP-CTERM system-associated protein [Qipengyuania proteolytica]MBX7496216.1 FemAB family PEP-CTERM system-associated protein [Qipengyuania proteolytica]
MNAPVNHSVAIRQVDPRDPKEAARIEAFVAGQGASAFHRPLWLRAIEQGTGNRALGLVAERGGIPSGWLPLSEIHSPLFGRALVSSGFGVGGGVIAEREGDALALCKAAEELALRRSASTIELRGPVAPEDWQSIEGKHANFAADLAVDDEAQLLAIPRKARAEVRKGLAGDMTVSTGSDEAERASHYAVYAESVRNLGTPVFPRRLFDAVLDLFGEDADILTVRHEGAPVASVLSLYHRGTAMPFWGGGTYAARALRGNERMYYELMLHARRKGCTRFDFGRSKVGSGPFAFKKNWGFEAEPLVYRSWSAPGVAARNIDPTDEGYSAKIALWKKLPLPVANRIGPWIARGLG